MGGNIVMGLWFLSLFLPYSIIANDGVVPTEIQREGNGAMILLFYGWVAILLLISVAWLANVFFLIAVLGYLKGRINIPLAAIAFCFACMAFLPIRLDAPNYGHITGPAVIVWVSACAVLLCLNIVSKRLARLT